MASNIQQDDEKLKKNQTQTALNYKYTWFCNSLSN